MKYKLKFSEKYTQKYIGFKQVYDLYERAGMLLIENEHAKNVKLIMALRKL